MAQIDVMDSMGSDALENFFQVIIPSNSFLTGVTNQLNMRILDINIPSREITTYSRTKRGRTEDVPNGEISQEKKISMNIRLDRRLAVYKAISHWMQAIKNNQTSEINNVPSSYRLTFECNALSNLDDSAVPMATWKFVSGYPTQLGDISYSEEGYDAIQCSLEITCRNVIYPDEEVM